VQAKAQQRLSTFRDEHQNTQTDLLGTHRLRDRNRVEPGRPQTEHGDVLAVDVTRVNRIHAVACSENKHIS
jgi:hypothetical protein